MVASTNAIYRNGVLVPATPLDLKDEQQVRITVETVQPPAAGEASPGLLAVRARMKNRLVIDPALAEQIALDHALDLNNT